MSRIIQLSAALMVVAACHSVRSDVVEEVVEERVVSEDANFRVIRVVADLEHPWSLAFLPDGSLLITERPGRMHRLEGGELTAISGLPEITAQGQGGLFDVLPHPEFAANRLIYFAYSDSYDGGVGTHVSRAVLEDDRLTDVELLFRMDPPGSGGRHFGGRLAFDATNHLYVTIGDRADRDLAQQL
ncbi:MAG: PQQ-dependent sugar dehydrogenase, partial [Pseudomonadales bacterium]